LEVWTKLKIDLDFILSIYYKHLKSIPTLSVCVYIYIYIYIYIDMPLPVKLRWQVWSILFEKDAKIDKWGRQVTYEI